MTRVSKYGTPIPEEEIRRIQIVQRAVAKTLRTVAGWVDDAHAQDFYYTAREVETERPEWIVDSGACTICQETECDPGCPYEDIRR